MRRAAQDLWLCGLRRATKYNFPQEEKFLNRPDFYDLEFIAGGSQVDCFGRLRISELLNFEQAAATLHAEALGVGREVMTDRLNAVWMIVRTRVELTRPILYGESVRARTYPVKGRGATLPRETELFVGDERVGSAHTFWVLANVDTHKLIRPAAFYEVAELPEQPPRFAAPERIDPIEPLGEAEPHRIRYSELDMNRHVHNTKYLDFAADHLRLEDMEGKWVSEFTVSFSEECVAGETVYIASAGDGGRTYVRGSGENGKTKFELELKLADI